MTSALGRVTHAARDAGGTTFCVTEFSVCRSGCLFGLVFGACLVGRFAGYKAWWALPEGLRVPDLPIEPLQRLPMRVDAAADEVIAPVMIAPVMAPVMALTTASRRQAR